MRHFDLNHHRRFYFIAYLFVFVLSNIYDAVVCQAQVDSTASRHSSHKDFVLTNQERKKRYILGLEKITDYIEQFNRYDIEYYSNLIPNSKALSFLSDNIPLIDIPDRTLEEIYYFRWWTFRKHIVKVPIESPTYVITEFLPVVSWAGKYNTINCAMGHHFREGRWLHESKYLESYARVWFSRAEGINPRQYSSWPATSIWQLYRLTGNLKHLKDLLPELLSHFRIMKRTNYDDRAGLFFNTDNRDGMELSIGGIDGSRGLRPTLNSYMIAEAFSIARINRLVNIINNETISEIVNFGNQLLQRMNDILWDKTDKFFKVCPYKPRVIAAGNSTPLVSVRELLGYTPWYFNLMDRSQKLGSWSHITDKKGFFAQYGLTTAEQRHPEFKLEYSKQHECRWNGPSWPYATSITLTAMANILQDPKQDLSSHQSYLSPKVFYDQLKIYARAHHRSIGADELPESLGDGKSDAITVPWIDENIHPYTGDWISRTVLMTWENNTWSKKKGGKERGKDYNHSTFVDLILSGLLGFNPRSNNSFEFRPLIPRGRCFFTENIITLITLVPIDAITQGPLWSTFAVDQLKYRGRFITIVYDESGTKYGLGMGLTILVDGEVAAKRPSLPRRLLVKF